MCHKITKSEKEENLCVSWNCAKRKKNGKRLFQVSLVWLSSEGDSQTCLIFTVCLGSWCLELKAPFEKASLHFQSFKHCFLFLWQILAGFQVSFIEKMDASTEMVDLLNLSLKVFLELTLSFCSRLWFLDFLRSVPCYNPASELWRQ